MAKHIKITNSLISQSGLTLTIESTNDELPGEKVKLIKAYETNLTVQQIKSQIQDDLNLAWSAISVKEWSF